MRRRPPQQGFVLVMTLVMIGIAGLALARLANGSLALTLQARRGEVELQRRWATLSLQTQLLRDPEWRLQDLAAEGEQQAVGWPSPAAIGGGCRLGTDDYVLLLADEQAKANVNVLYDRRPDLLPGLLGEAAHEAALSAPVEVRPRLAPNDRRRKQFFRSWGELVAVDRLREPDSLVRVAQTLTPWGDGELNVTRACEATLEAVARLELNGPEARRLLEVRQGFDGDLDELLELAEIPRRKAFKLKRLLTERSAAHTAWIIRREEGREASLVVTVSDAAASGVPPIRTYRWP